MKKIQFILFLIAIIGLSACGSTITEETAENFKQVILPDSSVVYLNHNSKLMYDKEFNPRKLKLVGEAFFSVNDGKTPFVIETEEGEEVTVEGTEFNLIATLKGVAIEVEIGIVTIRIGSGKMFKQIRRGQRVDFSRHDNGLHLGQAKHGHRKWIGVMDKDFKKSGMTLRRSSKHSKFIQKGNKNLRKSDKGGSPKKKSIFPKSGGDKKTDKGSKRGGEKKGKTGKKKN